MSTLLILLPQGLPSSSLEYDHAVSHDGLTFAGRGCAPLSQLPALAGAGHDVVLLVPACQLSWHTVELPTRITGPQLRPALHALLEDTLLDEPAQLHLALSPNTSTHRQVAACDKAWLQAHLHALEERGYTLARIVPEFEPSTQSRDQPAAPSATRLHVRAGPAGPQLVCLRGASVCTLPLSTAALHWLQADTNLVLSTDAASARAAETLFNQSIALYTLDQVWLDALRSEWNLAQFDLARKGTAHTLRQWRRAWTTFRTAPEWQATRWCAVALIVIQLVGLNVWAWRERSVIEAKRLLQKEILQQTFPEVSVVIDPALQMERQLSQLQQSHGAPSARDFDAMLLALANSPTPLPRPTTLDFRDGVLRLPGYTLRADQSNALRAHLQASGYALSTDSSGVTLSVPGGTP